MATRLLKWASLGASAVLVALVLAGCKKSLPTPAPECVAKCAAVSWLLHNEPCIHDRICTADTSECLLSGLDSSTSCSCDGFRLVAPRDAEAQAPASLVGGILSNHFRVTTEMQVTTASGQLSSSWRPSENVEITFGVDGGAVDAIDVQSGDGATLHQALDRLEHSLGATSCPQPTTDIETGLRVTVSGGRFRIEERFMPSALGGSSNRPPSLEDMERRLDFFQGQFETVEKADHIEAMLLEIDKPVHTAPAGAHAVGDYVIRGKPLILDGELKEEVQTTFLDPRIAHWDDWGTKLCGAFRPAVAFRFTRAHKDKPSDVAVLLLCFGCNDLGLLVEQSSSNDLVRTGVRTVDMSRNRLLRLVKDVFPTDALISSIKERPDREGIRRSLAATRAMTASLATMGARHPEVANNLLRGALAASSITKTVGLSPQDASQVAEILALPEDGGVAERRDEKCHYIQPTVRVTGLLGDQPDAGRTFTADLDLTACRSLDFAQFDAEGARIYSDSVVLRAEQTATLSKILAITLGVDGGF
ncbi:MAG: hypothetical protein JST54_32165 [Deltaproteobacteria bacterium]|nr:hypothetical protein [Deltaproteobacteria bacterium]